jgi:hypothetical protein
MRGEAQPWVDCQVSSPAKPFPIAAQAAILPASRPSPCSFHLTAPHPDTQHHDRAIHQGLGMLFSPQKSGCLLTRNSARRSHASPASNLPASLAAPSSPPRPSDQVIHPIHSNVDNN